MTSRKLALLVRMFHFRCSYRMIYRMISSLCTATNYYGFNQCPDRETVCGTLSSLRFTRTGREIASVLTQRVDAEYFVDAGQWLSNLLGASAVVEWRREPSKDWIAIPVSKSS